MAQYERKFLERPNFFQRLFRQVKRENAYIEINNLLADHPVEQITRPEVRAILDKYGLEKADPQRKRELMKPMLVHVLIDGVIDEQEQQQLDHLCEILNLPRKVVQELLHEMADELYSEAVSAAIVNKHLSPKEQAELDALARTLGLAPDETHAIAERQKKRYLDGQLNEGLADELWTPEEEQELQKAARDIGARPSFSDRTVQLMNRYRRYWQLRFGPLPSLQVPYNLYNGEECHARMPAQWLEYRTETTRYNYSGPDARIKIAKGFYWQAGSASVGRIKEEVLRPIDQGELLITSRRLLFIGQNRSRNIRFSHILGFEPFDDGLLIQKDAGRHPFLRLEGDMHEIPLLMERLLDLNY